MTPDKPARQNTGLVLLTMVGVIAVLHFAEDVLVPVGIALLLAFLLAPTVGRLERLGANRTVAVSITSVIAFTLLGAVLYLVVQQFIGLVEELPSYRENLLTKIHSLPGSGGGLDKGVETVKELTEELAKSSPGKPASPEIAKVQIVEPPPNVAQVVRGLFGPLVGPASTAAIVLVFVVFMLLQREDLRDRLVRLLGAREMHITVTALDDAAQRVSRYLSMQLLINSMQGAIVGIGFYFIGLPQALLWGALTAVLRFIPYLGPALAAAGPIALALAFFPGWTHPLMVIGLILVLEFISNNVLEPRLYGSSVGVSSFALIVAAVFWTWLWGTAGLFLATPLTVCLVVMGKYIPQLAFLNVALGDQPVLEVSERFYQRLLANDPDEAQMLLDESLAETSLVELSDAILLPALRFIEHDHDRGAFDDARRDALVAKVDELIDDLPEAAEEVVAGAAAKAVRLRVLCLPAADAADETAAHLLARVAASGGVDVEVVGVAALKSEMIELAAQARADVFFVSAAPPAAVLSARYLCKKLRARFPDTPILVGLWGAEGDLTRATERLVSAGASRLVVDATGAMAELSRRRQPLLQGVRSDTAELANA
ncbi:MAG: AI-2E family transporter [Burkholderiaceae bacterium]